MKTDQELEVDGRVFKTAKEMCNHYGVSQDVYTKRRRKGYNLKQGLGLEPIYNPTHNQVNFRGLFFASEKEMCRYYKVSYAVYNNRKKSDMTTEQCLGLVPTDYKQSKIIEFNGKKYNTPEELCDAYDFPYSTFCTRMRQNSNLSIEDALKIPIAVTFRGTSYKSYKDLSELHGVSYDTFRGRRRLKYSLEECLGLEGRGIDCRCKLGRLEINGFYIIKYAYKGEYDNKYYYECKCLKCEEEDFLTFDEMKKHTCNMVAMF